MAEWLRRLTWNQMGSSRAGSNPADCEDILPFFGNICRLFRIHAPLAYIKQVFYSFVIMRSWPSGKGVWLEIRWDIPAQVRILLTVRTFCHFSETSVDYSGYIQHWHILNKFFTHLLSCSHGRVVKASDSKSDGIFPAQVRILLTASTFCLFSVTSIDDSWYKNDWHMLHKVFTHTLNMQSWPSG